MATGFDLTNKVALVTGASRGIGFGVAQALARAGAKVAVAARTMDELRPLAESIGGLAVAIDVTSVSSIGAGVDRVASSVGSTFWSTTPGSAPTTRRWR